MSFLSEDAFSVWMRTNLKDAFNGLITQDIDFVIVKKDISKPNFFSFYFIEEKNSQKARVGPAQKIIFKMFDDLLTPQIFRIEKNLYKFLGTYILYLLKEYDCENFTIWFKSMLKDRPKHDIDPEVLKKLWDCNGIPVKIKTEKERTRYRGSILERLFDKCYEVYTKDIVFIEKIDWIFVNYCSGYFIFLEELTNGEKLTDRKRKFIQTIDSIFNEASKENEITLFAKNPKSKSVYRYLGYYTLSFSKTNPDNSHIIILNDKQVKKNDLIKLLNMDTNEILLFRDNK